MRDALLVALVSASANAQSADRFDVFGGAAPATYQIDLARNFFASPEAERAARRTLVGAADALFARRDSLGAAVRRDGRSLESVLAAVDSLQRLSGRHFAYLSLAQFLDTRNAAAGDAARALTAALQRDFAFVFTNVAALPTDSLDAWTRRRPSLARWRFLVDQARAPRRPARDSASATVAATVAGNMTAWQPALFQSLLRETDFGKVAAPNGTLDVRADGGAIINSSDRRVREQGFQLNRQGLARHRDSYATILGNTIASRNALARLRGYRDHREESYGARFLTPSDVNTVLARLADAAESNKRYERLRVAHVRTIAGFDSVHTWDLPIPEPGAATPRFTIAEASRVVAAALEPLGTAYGAELTALLDPRNGRLDLNPRPNRVERQGFSTGSVGYPSTFFQGRFGGYVDDVVTLAHEAGHAVQNMLMDRARVPSAYAGGPDYFTESFAGFNELLVTDYLYRSATDRAARIYYLQRFLDQATDVFRVARESRVEDSLYADARPGPRSADELEALEQQIGERYSVWFHPGGERVMEWVNAVHFFTRPLYRVNYVYSKLLALVYFDRYARQPAAFLDDYRALLANGYDAPPTALLGRFVHVRLDDPDVVRNAVRIVDERTAALQRLYAGRDDGAR